MSNDITPAPHPEDVTGEMIDALATLLLHRENDIDLARAVDTLDKAGLFAPIHEARRRDEEMHARLIAGLRGIDLDDRYPKGDENGIIRPIPTDTTCVFGDDCPYQH